MKADILEIQDLTVSFPTGKKELTAVDHAGFTLKKGLTTAIVGESGSGKSVTALAIMGLLPVPPATVHSEKMLLFGTDGRETDLRTLDNRQMRTIRGNRISMIFQEPMSSLNPVARCGNQVTEAVRAHRKVSSSEARQVTLKLFREVMLPRPEQLYHTYPHELSGGQRQRVMIAMALASGPDILIADEPTTALDVTVQKNILRLLKELQESHGMAILFITHDLGLVSGFAHEVLVMKDGKIVETGKTKDIFTNPRHPYTQGLLACRPPLDKVPEKLPTVADFIQDKNDKIDKELPVIQFRDEEKYGAKLKEIYAKKPILETENLGVIFKQKTYKKSSEKEIRAVDGISLAVFPGEVLGLVGESGCGKTTLGRSVLRLIEPNEGAVRFNNTYLTGLRRAELKKLRKEFQIIFQDPYSSLNPRITVGKALEEPMVVYGLSNNRKLRKKTVLELLDKVGFDSSFYNRYPHELSGGQRQRVCIARALSVNPRFIVCDESVSALDVSVQAQVLNLLKDLRDEFGLTYIFISHDLSVVKFISDRIAVMKDGKIVETGPSEQVYRSPQSEYTKKLISAIPD